MAASWPTAYIRLPTHQYPWFAVCAALTIACAGEEAQDPVQPIQTVEDGAVGDVLDSDGAPEALGLREQRSVFDLGDNRLLAHAHVPGGLHLDASAPGFAKYTHFSHYAPKWRVGIERDGEYGSSPGSTSSRSAALAVPLSADEIQTFDAMALRIHTPRAQKLSIRVNGSKRVHTVASLKLSKGWQTVVVTLGKSATSGGKIQPGQFIEGENRISFGPVRKMFTLGWLRIGRHTDLAPLAEKTEVSAPTFDRDRDAFVLSQGQALSYYIYVPKDAHLVADVGSDNADATGCRINAQAIAESGFVDGHLTGNDAVLSLASLADQVIRLRLTATDCPSVTLSNARMTVPGTTPDVNRGKAPKYVVLWVMDTLRADRVRPFQPDARPRVPVFDKLAATGTVFRQYWVQGNESQTSHASVWTSLYPKNHNIRTAGNGGTWKLSKAFTKLPGQMAEAGFFTIGVTANGYVTKAGRYGDDFEVWRNLMREGIAVRNSIPSEKIVDISLGYFEKHYENGPVFLFIGTIDTHKPWIGRQPWLNEYDPGPYKGKHQKAAWPGDLGLVKGSMRCVRMPKPRDLQRIQAIYDSNVSYQDQQLGRFLDRLKEWGIADETMLIVTADHGEELWEVGRCGHGASVRETLVRVPLLIHYPPLFPGRVVVEGTEGVDVLPTILDAVGRDSFDSAQGKSLIALAQGAEGGYPTPSYASQYEYAHVMRLANWKYRVGRPSDVEFYDLHTDPEEMNDVVGKHPIAQRFVADALELFLVFRHRWKKRLWGVTSNMTERAACELEQRPPKAKKSAKRERNTDAPDPCAPPDGATR